MRIRKIGDIAILQLNGRIEMTDGAEEVRGKVRELLEWGHEKILLNLDRVTFVDTAGIEALLDSYDMVSENGGRLKFVSPGNGVLYSLSLTKLAMGTDVHSTVGKAIANFT